VIRNHQLLSSLSRTCSGFGRNWSIPRQRPSEGTCFRMSLDGRKRVPPLVSQTVLTTQLDIILRSQPDHERSFASSAYRIPPTAKLEIPELRLIVYSDLAPGVNKRKIGQ